jgi:dipeptidyl aminopeptidase/acylaminoacyl peptidase
MRSVATTCPLLLLLALAACSHAPRTGDAVLPPPAALTLSGVPPVPADLARRVGPYNEFRGVGLVDWQPDGRALLVNWRDGNTVQLFRLSAPGAALERLTQAVEPTRTGRYVPADGNLIVFARDAGGNEATQIYRLDLRTRTQTRLTDPERGHSLGPFNRAGTWLATLSVPLDRTAAGGRRDRISTELALLNPVTGTRRVVATLPGTGWLASDFSADDRALLVTRYQSATESQIHRVDLETGAVARLLPRAGEPAAFWAGAAYAPDGRQLFVATDRFGEFRSTYRVDPAGSANDPVAPALDWDALYADYTRNRRTLALIANEAGRGVVRLFDAATLKALPVPKVDGSVTGVRFSPDGTQLALAVTSETSPSSVAVLDLQTNALSWWARADTAGLSTDRFRPIEIVSWTSFDGRTISGLLTRPPTRFAGKRPVLIEIHGGPESQARLDFNGRLNYLINELGIALIEPNVRGSGGFGKTFVSLDNGMKREDAVRDIGALLDWIARQPDLDASRVAVSGGSYGGYMSLAVATHYSDRIRAAISVVGISHFVTFLERTESYRRDLRRAEYGDERDPAMRAFFERISPLANAQKIRVPMFILHGRNDPRVPVQEAEQIVRTLKASGVSVWSLIAENEGHGFAKKENADYAFYARLLFFERFLLAP